MTLLTVECIYLPRKFHNQARKFLESDAQHCANLIQNVIGLESPAVSLPYWYTTVITGSDQRYSPNLAELNFFLTVNPGVGEISCGVDQLSDRLEDAFHILKSINFTLAYKSGVHHVHWNRIFKRQE